MTKIDDSLNVTINIKWLIQICVIIAMIVGTWYQAQIKMISNHDEIQQLSKELLNIQERLSRIENKNLKSLEETNKTLMQKINIFNKDK
tara:strand:- start:780 stop:1046 length:267 start_codon:yes stop_codon:yes gene_type:complete